MRRSVITTVASAALLASVAGGLAAASGGEPEGSYSGSPLPTTVLQLTASNPQLAACMPNARVQVTDISTTDVLGFDRFRVRARHLAPDRDYTVFMLETARAPFGAAEYLGDITTDKYGNADNTFKAIVDEAFASTIVNGQRVRVELNQVGMWFADPAGDDFCGAAPGIGGTTPFDGDNAAGVQAFNSANTQPLPAP